MYNFAQAIVRGSPHTNDKNSTIACENIQHQANLKSDGSGRTISMGYRYKLSHEKRMPTYVWTVLVVTIGTFDERRLPIELCASNRQRESTTNGKNSPIACENIQHEATLNSDCSGRTIPMGYHHKLTHEAFQGECPHTKYTACNFVQAIARGNPNTNGKNSTITCENNQHQEL